MNKSKHVIKCGENKEIFLLGFDFNKATDAKIIRYAKASLSKRNINIFDPILKDFNHRCPFCNHLSSYDINYTIDRIEKEVIANSVNLIKNKDGMVSYHCRRGKKSDCNGSLLNPNSIKYISVCYNMDEKDANEYILKRNKSPFYKNNFNNLEDYKKSQSRSIEWYIDKYGYAEGNSKYTAFCNLKKLQNNSKYLIEKYGKAGFEEICKKKSVTLKTYIEKYGEIEGSAKFKLYRKSLGLNREKFIEKYGIEKWEKNRISIKEKLSHEYLVNTLGFEEGNKKFINYRKSLGLNKLDFIEKHGMDKWISKISKSKSCSSKEANKFFEILNNRLLESGITLQNISTNDKEYFLWDSDYRRIYFYDFYAEYKNIRLIIEYDQVFWHSSNNLKENEKYSGDVFDSVLDSNMKIEYDDRKMMLAKSKGYAYIRCFSNLRNPFRDRWKYEKLINETLKKLKNEGIE